MLLLSSWGSCCLSSLVITRLFTSQSVGLEVTLKGRYLRQKRKKKTPQYFQGQLSYGAFSFHSLLSVPWGEFPALNIHFKYIGGFPGDSDGKEPSCNAGDLGSIPGSGRSPGEGNGNPFQYSCLGEPPWTEEPWRATVHVVTESDVTECQTLKHIVCGFSCKPHHMLAEQHSMQPDRKPGTSLF